MNHSLALRFSRRDLLVGAGAIPLLSATPASAAEPVLTARGPQLLYGGQSIRMRGVVIADLLKPGRPQSISYHRIACEWGANAVRISVHPGYWKADIHGATARIAANVRSARQAGLYVILCWHALGFPDGYEFRPPATWNTRQDAFDTDMTLCADFWKGMAERYAADGGVAFEIFNEPIRFFKMSWADFRNWPLLQKTWTSLINNIIRPRASNLVICSGPRYSYDLREVAQKPVAAPNVAYAWHVYPRDGESTPSEWSAMLNGLTKVAPVIVTEWGFSYSGPTKFVAKPTEFADPLLRFMDAAGLSWFAYAYSAKSGPSLLEGDWRSPTPYGKYVKNALARARNANLCQA